MCGRVVVDDPEGFPEGPIIEVERSAQGVRKGRLLDDQAARSISRAYSAYPVERGIQEAVRRADRIGTRLLISREANAGMHPQGSDSGMTLQIRYGHGVTSLRPGEENGSGEAKPMTTQLANLAHIVVRLVLSTPSL